MKNIREMVISAIERDVTAQKELNAKYGIDINYLKKCDIEELNDKSNKHSLGMVIERYIDTV